MRERELCWYDLDEKWQNYIQNKQLQFTAQLKSNKSQKWQAGKHLNARHKTRGETRPASSMAMHSNCRISVKEKEGEKKKKHLITSNSCKPFWSPKVSERLRRSVCSVSGNDLPSHEHGYVLQQPRSQHPLSLAP